MPALDDNLLDALAVVFAHAAVDKLLAEQKQQCDDEAKDRSIEENDDE